MCEEQRESAVSESLLRKLEVKVAQTNVPDNKFCHGLPGWCPCLLRSPASDENKATDESIQQKQHDEMDRLSTRTTKAQ